LRGLLLGRQMRLASFAAPQHKTKYTAYSRVHSDYAALQHFLDAVTYFSITGGGRRHPWLNARSKGLDAGFTARGKADQPRNWQTGRTQCAFLWLGRAAVKKCVEAVEVDAK